MIGTGDYVLLFAIGLTACSALAVVVYLVLTAEESPFRRFFGDYEDELERHTKFLILPYSGAQVARLQIIVCSVLIAVALVLKSFGAFTLVVLIAAVPPYMLWKKHILRVQQLEDQLDGWLLMLSNALKATPSIGEAIESTVKLVPTPFSEELDLLIKENQLGTPIDRAVRQMAQRINSPVVSGALATIVIARTTGGDLSAILESSAATLRESARLEGVLRTKTSDARGQLFVLAIIPFVLCGIIGWMDPTWFTPLTESRVGNILIGVGLITWAIALVWARKIVDIDV